MKKPLWFKAKRYGWGWTPVTWQGWLVIAVFVGLIVSDCLRLHVGTAQEPAAYLSWLVDAIFLVLVLVGITWRTGEKPRWRWGGKDDQASE